MNSFLLSSIINAKPTIPQTNIDDDLCLDDTYFRLLNVFFDEDCNNVINELFILYDEFGRALLDENNSLITSE